jgi:peptidoglycan hydrolase-like protein with peptidoglycan-binding domain
MEADRSPFPQQKGLNQVLIACFICYNLGMKKNSIFRDGTMGAAALFSALLPVLFSVVAMPVQAQTVSSNSCFTFTRNLTIGSTGQDVTALQTFLKADGEFPQNVSVTAYYGVITENAVKSFQTKYSSTILAPLGLSTPTGFFGPATLAQVNKLYSCSTVYQNPASTQQTVNTSTGYYNTPPTTGYYSAPPVTTTTNGQTTFTTPVTTVTTTPAPVSIPITQQVTTPGTPSFSVIGIPAAFQDSTNTVTATFTMNIQATGGPIYLGLQNSAHPAFIFKVFDKNGNDVSLSLANTSSSFPIPFFGSTAQGNSIFTIPQGQTASLNVSFSFSADDNTGKLMSAGPYSIGIAGINWSADNINWQIASPQSGWGISGFNIVPKGVAANSTATTSPSKSSGGIPLWLVIGGAIVSGGVVQGPPPWLVDY